MSYYSRRSERMSDEDLDSYDSTRLEKYPDTYYKPHPNADAERDYNEYSARRIEANEATSAYDANIWRQSKRPEQDIEKGHMLPPNRFDINRRTKRVTSEVRRNFAAGRHDSLLSDAAEASSSTLVHARARDKFLDTHPYGYRDATQRTIHDNRCDSAFIDANYYREAYDDHRAGSSRQGYAMTDRDRASYLYASDEDSGRGRVGSSSRARGYEGDYEYDESRTRLSSRSPPRSESRWYDGEDGYDSGSYSRGVDRSFRGGPSSGAYSSSY